MGVMRSCDDKPTEGGEITLCEPLTPMPLNLVILTILNVTRSDRPQFTGDGCAQHVNEVTT